MAFLYTSTNNATVTATTTEGTLLAPGNGVLTLPGGELTVGTLLRISVRGFFVGVALTPTLQLRVRVNDGTTNHVIGDTGAQVMGVGSVGRGFSIDFGFVYTAVGGFGAIKAEGRAIIALTATTAAPWDMANGGVGLIDTSVANTIDVTAQWSAAAGNSIRARVSTVEIANT